jgi:hypothetical protein
MKKGLDFTYYLHKLLALRGQISQFILRKEKCYGELKYLGTRTSYGTGI